MKGILHLIAEDLEAAELTQSVLDTVVGEFEALLTKHALFQEFCANRDSGV